MKTNNNTNNQILTEEELNEVIKKIMNETTSLPTRRELLRELKQQLEEQREQVSSEQFRDQISKLIILVEDKKKQVHDQIIEQPQPPQPQPQPQQKQRMIKYDICFNRPKNAKPKEISFEDVDNYDFSKHFNEFLVDEDYVHLYFDFDTIKSNDEFDDVCCWLDRLVEVFGEYSMGGYCDNDDMAAMGFRKYEDGGHWLSMHVVFYQTCISSEDLVHIMKHTQKTGYLTDGVHKLCDPNVYKLVSTKAGQTSRQVMRHVLSDKIYKLNSTENKTNHGFILGNYKPSTQIIQIRGTEPIITQEQWGKLFKVKSDNCIKNTKENTDSVNNVVTKTTKEKTDSVDVVVTKTTTVKKSKPELLNLDASENLIKLTDEEMSELLSNFEPTYDNFINIVSNLMHSPFGRDDVLKWIESWYFSGDHQNKETIKVYCEKYHEITTNNKWFWSVVKHLKTDERKKWRTKGFEISIEDTDFNLTGKMNLSILRCKNYKDGSSGVRVNEFISDLRKCVVFINLAVPIYIVKDYDGVRDVFDIRMLDLKKFRALMTDINLGRYQKDVGGRVVEKTINAWMIYDSGNNKNYIMKKGLRFFDERREIFSVFCGYDFKRSQVVDVSKIELYLNHIREVIARGQELVYEYILNWFAFILQKPADKTEVALVITGKEGTGKNVFTNVLCKLLGRYANPNLTNISHIVGRFNGALEDKKLIVCNELSSADTNKYLNSDALKSVITDKTVNIETKGIDSRLRENVVNLILVSNHFGPVRITDDDRRYLVIETSDQKCKQYDYFKSLHDSFNDDFYNTLFNFFMNRDISNFNPRDTPDTEEKRDLIEANKSSYQMFYEEYEEQFKYGWTCKDCYRKYADFARDMGFAVCAANTFGSKIRGLVKHKRIRSDGELCWVYIKE